MKCEKCKAYMTKARLINTEIWFDKGKGFFSDTARSTISCYVCPICGRTELQADKPQVFKTN